MFNTKDLEKLANLLNGYECFNTMFNLKYCKNLIELEKIINELNQAFELPEDYKEYLMKKQQCKTEKAIKKLNEEYKDVIERRIKEEQELHKKYGKLKVEFEEIKPEEMPDDLPTQIIKAMMKLGWIEGY